MFGEAALEGRLPRRGLAFAARDDVAHDAFVDERRIDAGALHRFADHHRTELGAVKSLSVPRNLPVGSRTALTITASAMNDLHLDKRVRPEECVEPRTDECE